MRSETVNRETDSTQEVPINTSLKINEAKELLLKGKSIKHGCADR
jgi:hypothetical protein